MTPGERLEKALQRIRLTAVALDGDLRRVERLKVPRPEKLIEAVATIGGGSGRPPLNPDRYSAEWEAYINGRSSSLSPRAIRTLCWAADVANDKRFYALLESGVSKLSARSLQGLVRSYHARWKATGADDVGFRARKLTEEYRGPNRVVERWKGDTAALFGPLAAQKFSSLLLKTKPEVSAKEWGLNEQTPFFVRSMRHAAERARESFGVPHVADAYFTNILSWPHWTNEELKAEVSAAILDPRIQGSQSGTERLRQWILADPRFGDPRLRRRNWIDVSEPARSAFIQWLSRADIVFFFEHVLPKGRDPHGRKDFWLKYVDQVVVSRPLLNEADRARLILAKHTIGAHVGSLKSPVHSAFLLQFRDVLVIEYSDNASCYFFTDGASSVVPDFWSQQPFSSTKLRDTSRCEIYFRHVSGWQYSVRHHLARYGISPVVR